MAIDLDQLPESSDALKALLVKVVAERDAKQTRITQLEQALRFLKLQRFGKRSERHEGQAELALFNEAELLLAASPDAGQSDAESTIIPAHKRKRKGRRQLADDLPRVDIIHDLPEQQKTCACGLSLKRIGEEVLEQLVILPPQRFVRRHVKLKYACSCKGCMRTASMPKQPLPGTQASPQLLAYVAVSKYHDGLPLYRQEKMAKRDGLRLPRAAMARWLIDATALTQPIINLLQDTFFGYDIAWSDDTGMQVLKENGRKPEHKSYLWIRRGGPPHQPVVLVDYSPSRSAKTAYSLLQHFHGYLVCDAYAGYNLSIQSNGLLPVLCNDHARRRFVEVLKRLGATDPNSSQTKQLIAHQALEFYRRLYRIERHPNQHDPLANLQHRQLHAVPLWDEFIHWAHQVYAAGVAHDGTRDALQYLLSHAEGLRRYCTDGRLPISNIQAEHVAKTIAIARKNFLFADTPAGAHASAQLFGLLETAKANGHNPHRYLSVLFTETPNATGLADYEALLPWHLSTEEVDRRYASYPVP